jgi:hypothetical protein
VEARDLTTLLDLKKRLAAQIEDHEKAIRALTNQSTGVDLAMKILKDRTDKNEQQIGEWTTDEHGSKSRTIGTE